MMTYTAGPANNLQLWLNKYIPELQSKEGQGVSTMQAKNLATYKAVSSSAQVSLSPQARALSGASHQQYSDAQVNQSKLKQHCHDLYEKGCLTAEEFGRMTGDKLPHNGRISESIEFLERFVGEESVDGDVEGAKALNAALSVLREVESPMTALKAGQERQASHFVREYRNLLQETGAETTLIHKFDELVGVFDALAELRGQTHKGVVTTYASLSMYLRGQSDF